MGMTLFYTDLRGYRGNGDALLPLLSDARREIVLRRVPSDRIASAACELLLRYALADVGYGHLPSVIWEGKPRFADGAVPYAFNLSHAGQTVALLFADGKTPCGVDCEEFRPLRNRESIAARMFTAAEREWTDTQSDPVRAFFRIWTAKEAFIKYTGEGFSHALSDVAVDMPKGTVHSLQSGRAGVLFHFASEHGILCTVSDIPTAPAVREIPFDALLF